MPTAPTLPDVAVHRIEVHRRPETGDPLAETVHRELAPEAPGLTGVRRIEVYLIQGSLDLEDVERVARGLLADPVMQHPVFGSSNPSETGAAIEIHPKPGVMDPAAASIRTGLAAMFDEGQERRIEVRTGLRWEFDGLDTSTARSLAARSLANPVIHDIFESAYLPDAFPTGHDHPFEVRDVLIRDLDEDALESLSREAHLFLSLEEMKAIQRYYR